MQRYKRDIPDEIDEEISRKKRCVFSNLVILKNLLDVDEDLHREIERFYVRHDIDLEGMCQQEFKLNFRLDNYADFNRLLTALRIPPITCDNGTIASPRLALAVVLRRLCYPNRWVDCMKLLGRDQTQLSRIFNHTIDVIWETHGYLMSTLNQPVLSYENLQAYCAAIARVTGGCYGTYML